jgi:hypothetical protein
LDVKVKLSPTTFGTTDFGSIALDLIKKAQGALVLIIAQAGVIAACKKLRQQQGYRDEFYSYLPTFGNSVLGLKLGGPVLERTKLISLTIPINFDTPVLK